MLRELRPQWTDEGVFVARIDEVQRPQGYRLVAALEGDAPALAAAGFHVFDHLSWGRVLYIDDLAALPAARRHGLARGLLDWLEGEGRRLGCSELHLDSAVGEHRAAAHRLYLNAGLRISSHHFSRSL